MTSIDGSPAATSTVSTLTNTTDCATAVSSGSTQLSILGETNAVLSEKNAALRNEIEMLKGQLKAAITAKPNRTGWRSKNGKRIKLGSLSKEMVDNSYEIAIVIKSKLFPHVKFLPDNWEIYSTSRKTLCGIIMDVVVCDETMEDEKLSIEEVWHTFLAKIVALKYTMERNQSLQKLRMNFMSECT